MVMRKMMMRVESQIMHSSVQSGIHLSVLGYLFFMVFSFKGNECKETKLIWMRLFALLSNMGLQHLVDYSLKQVNCICPKIQDLVL